MVVVLHQIVGGDGKVVVGVQLPEFAVQHVKVLVAEVLRHLVDVFFLVDDSEEVDHIGAAELAQRDATRMGLVHDIVYPYDDCQRVFLLKLGRVLEELEPRVVSEQLFRYGIKSSFTIPAALGCFTSRKKRSSVS